MESVPREQREKEWRNDKLAVFVVHGWILNLSQAMEMEMEVKRRGQGVNCGLKQGRFKTSNHSLSHKLGS